MVSRGADTTGQPESSSRISRRVLVAVPQADVSRQLQALLYEGGFGTRFAGDARATLAQCRQDPPVLIVVSAELPDMDGFELCRQLSQSMETVPIVMLLNSASAAQRQACFAAGAADYLLLPLVASDVRARIRRQTADTAIGMGRGSSGSPAGPSATAKGAAEDNVAALLMADDRLRLLFDSLPISVLAFDRDGRFSFINSVGEKWYGRPRSEIIGKRLGNFFDPMAQKEYDQARDEVITLRRPSEREFERTYPDGTKRILHTIIVPNFDRDGVDQGQFALLLDITERKLAERALRRSEAQLRLLSDSLPVAMFSYDRDGRYTFVNRLGEKWLNRPREKLIGLHPRELLGGHFDSQLGAAMEAAQKGETVTSVVRISHPDGNTRDVEVTYAPSLDESGAVVGNFSLAQDITERKRAARALRESDRSLRLLADSLPVAMISYDREGRYIFVNRVAEDWLNHSRQELIGRRPQEMFGEAFNEQLGEALVNVRKGRTTMAQARLRHPDGVIRDLEITYVPSIGDDGTQQGHFSLVQDVTHRRQTEDELRRSEAMLLESQRIAGLGSWEWDDIKERMVWATDEYFRIHGLDPSTDSIARSDYIDLVHPEDREAFNRHYVDTGVDPKPYTREHRIIRPDGVVRYLMKRAEPVFSEDGKLRGYRGTAQDITDLKILETQLHQAQKMEAVGQLTGGLAHDFNNLLAVIIGNAELLCERLGQDDRTLDAVISAATRGAELTQRLLAFSRRQALQPRAVDLQRLVNDMISLLRRSLGETIEIAVAFDSDLWTCEVDPGQLENAILNLAINASHAMPDGGLLSIETRNLSLTSETATTLELRAGDYIILTVRDTGCGIAPEHLDRVFEPFFTTKEVGEGSGLGLAMIFGFAKQSGGHASVESNLGHGTSMTLYLPRAYREEDKRIQQTVEVDPQCGRGKTILVVEDDVDLRGLIVHILESLEYRVVSADSAAGALAILDADARQVDLLLTDVVLPGGLGGRELAQEAMRRRDGIQVLFMSGYSQDAIIHHGRLDKGVKLLQKPFRRAEIAMALRQALEPSAT